MASWDGEDLTVDNKVLGDRMYKKGMNSFNSINVFKGDNRYMEGVEFLEQAIEHYLRADCDQEAADAAFKLAENYETHLINKKKGSLHEMGKYWELAGDCLDELNDRKSIECYEKCAYYQKSNNNFQSAAKTYQTIAKLQIKKEHTKEALEAFDKAAEAFLVEKSTAHAAKVLTEKAEYYVHDGVSYKESAMCFCEIIKKNLQQFENNSLSFKSMLSMLVHAALSQDPSHIDRHDKYLQDINDGWAKCFERKMVTRMVESYKKNDEAAFTRAVKDFDTISQLSTWAVDLLLIVKKIMKGTYDPSGRDTQYEWIQTTKTPDVTAEDSQDIQQGVYHKTETIQPTHSEKMADLLL